MKRIRPFDTRQLEAFDTLYATGALQRLQGVYCYAVSGKSFDADAGRRGWVPVNPSTGQESFFNGGWRETA